MDVDESELIGKPLSDAPKQEPTGRRCMGKKKQKKDGAVVRDDDGNALFGGYCRCWPGKGTDHVGDGRCKLHDGAPSGPANGNWKHGLYSDVIRPEDRATLKQIEDMTTAAKLESTMNVQVLKLRRAVEGMESEDRASFIDVFEDVVAGTMESGEGIDTQQLQYLAQMLGQNDRAIREWMDLIRKTAKDLHKITDGETVKHEHGVEADELGELKDMAEELF